MDEYGDEEENELPELGRRRGNWPVIWGSISIVFGLLGFLMSIFGVVQMVFIESSMKQSIEEIRESIPGTDPEIEEIREQAVQSQIAMIDAMKEAAPISIVISSVSALVALVLLFGGVLLCKRRRIAVPVLQTWAWLRILVGGFGIFHQYEMTSDMMRTTADAMDSSAGTAGTMGSMLNIITMASTVIGFLWMLWLPLFFFIWFNKENVKQDIKTGTGWS